VIGWPTLETHKFRSSVTADRVTHSTRPVTLISMPSDDENKEEAQVDTQETEGIQGQEVEELRNTSEGSQGNQHVQPPEKQKRVRKEPVVLVRETGKSLLPFSRVQKIIKADKDIPIVAKDATFLISLATEEFIKRLSETAKKVAEREKRSTVQHKDIATVVRRTDEFLFLEEIIPWLSSEPPARRKLKETASGIKGAPTLLDQFVVASKGIEEDDRGEQPDIIMNEDGTMFAVGDQELDGSTLE